MTIKSVLARWLPPAIADRFRASQERSFIPSDAWRYWGYRRDRGILAEDAFEKVGWVYACATAIARNMQQVPLRAVEIAQGAGGKTVRQLPDTHPYSRLLARPNEEDDFSGIIESSGLHLSLRGEAFWEIEDGATDPLSGRPRPANIYSRPPQWILKCDIENDRYANFQMNMPTLGKIINIPGTNVLFHKYFNPHDPWRGMAPMKAAYQAADTYYAAMLFNAGFFENGGAPAMVYGISKDSGLSKLDPDTRKRIRDEVRTFHSGVQNARGLLITGPGETVQFPQNLKDMDFENLLRFAKAEICGAMGVPPILLADVEDANRANSIEQRRTFWEEKIIPNIEDIVSLMNRKLSPRFGPGIAVKPDYSQVPALRKDLQALASGVIPWIDAWVLTINEARTEYFDMEPVPWGDEPFSLQYGNVDGEGPEAIQIPEPDEADDIPTADENTGKVSPEVGKRMLNRWKNSVLMRIRDGAKTPMQAFPAVREAMRAAKKYGVPPEMTKRLAHALQLELAVRWDSVLADHGAAELFEETVGRIASRHEGAN